MEALLTPTKLLMAFHLLMEEAILVVTFSLVFYLASRNWRNAVARATALMLAGVIIVYGGDVLLEKAQRLSTQQFLLRAQWAGIVLVPAAYLHLSDALLTSVGYQSLRRRWAVAVGYLAAATCFLFAAGSNLLIQGGEKTSFVPRVTSGPLFPIFVIVFALATIGGLYNVHRARLRSHTRAG